MTTESLQPESNENQNEMQKIAGEAHQTTEDVFKFLAEQINQVSDSEIREDVANNIGQWNSGARETFGLMLQGLQELRSNPDRWEQAQERALQNKEVILQNQQLVPLALLTSQMKDSKRASQYFQRAMKDLGIPAGVIFRGQLKEDK
ncbi:hypothetical protein A3K24_01770 [candidate division Kazan bacterium RIFCSPHIGHO2_01_FULL_44_14]|uniref:Uncharacterized protein n=1 Tax=candidate division Kazan bacterium RIFCSPLOWO2_01_FULL_45_19 TaxID=1798538 RepID=A0A1F4NQK1_UNCK3|nr:hypothetical protein [uncultured bacterium]AQS30976.1 hypothetical protein [uncultured bacterium]OGB73558.1 MAG: hypothetical protein A3K51_01770 [candidate division Kazan bacterium RIFCSPLOWO2_01_FULL_45_19]OGB77803.1 MAG: hypothetical protein A3K24_01770 [candidate division Kazan bacterium RIFCSPHIGHO2_01_FULL_44_14]